VNVTAADNDPVLPNDETTTDRAIPTEETILAAKDESEVHLEFSEMEFPTVVDADIADEPKLCPCMMVKNEPVKGNETDANELKIGLLFENTEERRPTEAAET